MASGVNNGDRQYCVTDYLSIVKSRFYVTFCDKCPIVFVSILIKNMVSFDHWRMACQYVY